MGDVGGLAGNERGPAGRVGVELKEDCKSASGAWVCGGCACGAECGLHPVEGTAHSTEGGSGVWGGGAVRGGGGEGRAVACA